MRAMARLDDLARLTDDPDTLTRLYLTPAHKAATDLVAGWMREAGMATSLDAVGTVIGRYAAADAAAPTLILGSHIDTVRNAGRFDGTLGVVGAIEAVAVFAARGERFPFAIEVVAFGDEEGVRFPVTLAGSRTLAGTFDAATLDVVDGDDIALRDALVAFGCDPDRIPAAARQRSDVLGFLELHIEQGPVLEEAGLPVGVVTAINGATRLAVTLEGEAGHAGTVPMDLRRDAYTAAAEMALAVERTACEIPDLVATVGRVDVRPGAVNVVPGFVGFTLDVRSPSDAARRDAVASLAAQCRAIADRRGIGCTIATTYDEAATQCDPRFIDGLSAATRRGGVSVRLLPSGAGHDGLAMSRLCPVGMLFVRCAGGVSHHPAETVTAADVEIAVRILVDFLRSFQASTSAL